MNTTAGMVTLGGVSFIAGLGALIVTKSAGLGLAVMGGGFFAGLLLATIAISLYETLGEKKSDGRATRYDRGAQSDKLQLSHALNQTPASKLQQGADQRAPAADEKSEGTARPKAGTHDDPSAARSETPSPGSGQ